MLQANIIVNRLAYSGNLALELLQGKKLRKDCVIIAGGDGTIHQLVNREMPSKPIGIIPSGTANDLAIASGISLEIPKAIEDLNHYAPHPIDLIDINGKKVVASAVIGSACDIIKRAERWKHNLGLGFLGKGIYLASAFTEIITGSNNLYKFKIIHDEGEDIFYGHTMLVMNQSLIASYLVVAPDAKNDDGYFDAVIFTSTSRWKNLGTLFFNSPSGIVRKRYKSAQIEIDGTAQFMADGEMYKKTSIFKIGILRKTLKILKRLNQCHKSQVHAELNF